MQSGCALGLVLVAALAALGSTRRRRREPFMAAAPDEFLLAAAGTYAALRPAPGDGGGARAVFEAYVVRIEPDGQRLSVSSYRSVEPLDRAYAYRWRSDPQRPPVDERAFRLVYSRAYAGLALQEVSRVEKRLAGTFVGEAPQGLPVSAPAALSGAPPLRFWLSRTRGWVLQVLAENGGYVRLSPVVPPPTPPPAPPPVPSLTALLQERQASLR